MTDPAQAPPTDLPLPLQAAVAVLLTMPWLQREADRAARQGGTLSTAQARMLMVLTEGSLRGSQIAERWQVTRAAVAESAASLTRAGYLRRRPDPEDGRAVRFELTVRGRRAMERFGLTTAGALAARLEPLSPADQRRLLEAARQLHAVLSTPPLATSPRRT